MCCLEDFDGRGRQRGMWGMWGYGVALGRSRRIKTNAQYDKNNKTTGVVLRHGSSVLGSKESEINLKASFRGLVHGSGMGIWPGRVSWQISTIICTYFTAASTSPPPAPQVTHPNFVGPHFRAAFSKNAQI